MSLKLSINLSLTKKLDLPQYEAIGFYCLGTHDDYSTIQILLVSVLTRGYRERCEFLEQIPHLVSIRPRHALGFPMLRPHSKPPDGIFQSVHGLAISIEWLLMQLIESSDIEVITRAEATMQVAYKDRVRDLEMA